jgi:hypothetical protein
MAQAAETGIVSTGFDCPVRPPQTQKIKPLIAYRFPLVEARHAHELLGKEGVTGKIVLVCKGLSLESGAA